MKDPVLKKLAPGQARFEARVFRKAAGKGTRAQWGVYDIAMASWPGYRNGKRITQDLSQAEAEAIAEELNGES